MLLYLESQASSCHCKYIRIIENRQRGTSVPDDMEHAHIKMTGQVDNEHLDISFIYHHYTTALNPQQTNWLGKPLSPSESRSGMGFADQPCLSP
jgi:hypothetical protein